ncbi:CIC11C00000000126 [Sungouiella intermedia]|uniref:CIC11C00000000126 n=1 Tax=Sungouiella intermedia TaxID=45354 RepID=A0A1L0BZP3_9ASCO|nr:CIC11C00000000126 [[Candida] intermedia]
MKPFLCGVDSNDLSFNLDELAENLSYIFELIMLTGYSMAMNLSLSRVSTTVAGYDKFVFNVQREDHNN